jgi:hypothetical protein
MFLKPDLLQSRFLGLLLKTRIPPMPIAQCLTATHKCQIAPEQLGMQTVFPSLIEAKATEVLHSQKSSSFCVPNENP